LEQIIYIYPEDKEVQDMKEKTLQQLADNKRLTAFLILLLELSGDESLTQIKYKIL
jgi:hypothetical protein